MRDSIYNSKECMERAMYDLMKMENEFARLNIEYGCHKVKEIMKSTCCSVFEVEDYIKQEQFTKEGMWLFDTSSLTELSEQLNNNNTNQDRITQLKSQLKHCKNPLQKLNIERELNKLYKNKER